MTAATNLIALTGINGLAAGRALLSYQADTNEVGAIRICDEDARALVGDSDDVWDEIVRNVGGVPQVGNVASCEMSLRGRDGVERELVVIVARMQVELDYLMIAITHPLFLQS